MEMHDIPLKPAIGKLVFDDVLQLGIYSICFLIIIFIPFPSFCINGFTLPFWMFRCNYLFGHIKGKICCKIYFYILSGLCSRCKWDSIAGTFLQPSIFHEFQKVFAAFGLKKLIFDYHIPFFSVALQLFLILILWWHVSTSQLGKKKIQDDILNHDLFFFQIWSVPALHIFSSN